MSHMMCRAARVGLLLATAATAASCRRASDDHPPHATPRLPEHRWVASSPASSVAGCTMTPDRGAGRGDRLALVAVGEELTVRVQHVSGIDGFGLRCATFPRVILVELDGFTSLEGFTVVALPPGGAVERVPFEKRGRAERRPWGAPDSEPRWIIQEPFRVTIDTAQTPSRNALHIQWVDALR